MAPRGSPALECLKASVVSIKPLHWISIPSSGTSAPLTAIRPLSTGHQATPWLSSGAAAGHRCSLTRSCAHCKHDAKTQRGMSRTSS